MAKYKIILNDDVELVTEVNRQLKNTNGYCPCALTQDNNTKCICIAFRESFAKGEEVECNCGKYRIVKTSG